MQRFNSEAELVDELIDHLRFSSITTEGLAREFDYRRGRADVIIRTLDGKVVAFEAKLTRWREALHQAYRNRCFASWSYVVLPKETALNASAFAQEFHKRNVGLCYVEDTRLVVLHEAREDEPLQAWLAEMAHSHITASCA